MTFKSKLHGGTADIIDLVTGGWTGNSWGLNSTAELLLPKWAAIVNELSLKGWIRTCLFGPSDLINLEPVPTQCPGSARMHPSRGRNSCRT